MRRAYHDTQWMNDENGQCIGLILGYDFCAEHEFGVGHIHRKFKMKEGVPIGLADRAVQTVPEGLHFEKFAMKPQDRRKKAFDVAMLAFNAYPYDQARFIEYAKGETTFYGEPGKQDISTAWGKDDFCVMVRGEENIRNLERLHQAFLEKDVVISRPMVSGFLRNGGLTFGILSVTPQADKDRILAQDEAHARLMKAAEDCGIYAKLEAAGKRFFALAPGWAEKEEGGALQFFLNPSDQKRHNHGWFRLDELEAWCEDRGPILSHPQEREWQKANVDFSIKAIDRMQEEGMILAQGVHIFKDVEANDPEGTPYRNLRLHAWVRKEEGMPAVRVMSEPNMDALVEQARRALQGQRKARP